jgi:autotransporter-associated beta strand protein
MSQSTAKRIGKRNGFLFAGLAVLLGAKPASAGWDETAAGTYDYLLNTNWTSDTINDDFPSTLVLAGTQTLTFAAGHQTAGDMNFNYGGNFALTLRATGANQTLTLGGNISLNTAGGTTANVSIGSTTANQNLNVNLGGATRTFSVAASRSLTFFNAISGSGGLIKSGSGELRLISASNSFTGGITVNGGTLAIGSDASMADSLLGSTANDLFLTNSTIRLGTANTRTFAFDPRRSITIAGTASFIGPSGYSNNFENLTITGNILGSGALSLSGSNSTLLAGNNTGINQISMNGMLRISSEANLGNPNSAFTALGFAAKGFSIMGTTLNNLSGHTFPWASNQSITWDIQDPDNTFTWDKNYNIGMNAADSQGTFFKSGLGTVVITTAQTYNNIQVTAPDTVMSGGVLKVDYTAGGDLPSPANGNQLAFSGGTLYLLGKSDAAVTENLANVKLLTGGGKLVVDNQDGVSSTTVNLGNFTTMAAPAAGSTLQIQTLNIGGGATVTTTATNTNELLGGGRIVFNGRFATNTTDTSGGTIGAYDGASAGLGDGTVGSTTNYLQTGTPVASPSATTYANSLQVATTAAAQNIDLGGNELILTSGALLFSGSHDYAITNGTLKSANSATTSDLIVHHQGTGTLTIGAAIANGGSGASTLTIAGPGKVVLTTANTYTGATYVEEAVLSISANTQLNNGANTSLSLYNGTLQTTATLSTGRSIGLAAGGGTIDVANGTTLTASGVVSGGRLTLANSDGGNGVLILSGANTFTSGVAINGGVVRLGNNGAFGTLGFNTLSFGSAATQTLQINGARTITVAGLTSAATTSVIENGAAGAATLNVYNGASNTYAGVIRDGSIGTLGLVKGGGGTLTLTNANTYTGPTVVYGGNLRVDGSLTSAVNVSDRGVLSGTGTVGNVTIANEGRLAPGASVGALTTGSLTFSGGKLAMEVNTSNNTADRISTSGGVDLGLGLASLEVSVLGSVSGSYNQTFTLISNTDLTDTTNGYFLGMTPTGNTYSFSSGTGLDYVINYAGGSNGNDVTIAFTSVPEPAGLSLIVLAGTALLGRRRRK